MKEIHLNKTKDYQIGNVRVDECLYRKIDKLATENEVSPQTIVREIFLLMLFSYYLRRILLMK